MTINNNNLGYFSSTQEPDENVVTPLVIEPNVQNLGYFSSPAIETQEETRVPPKDISTL